MSAAARASRLASGPGPEPDASPGLEPELDHLRRLVIMLLHRTYYGEVTFNQAEQDNGGNLRMYRLAEHRAANGELTVRAVPRETGT
jgi:hypothetical protein